MCLSLEHLVSKVCDGPIINGPVLRKSVALFLARILLSWHRRRLPGCALSSQGWLADPSIVDWATNNVQQEGLKPLGVAL